MAAFRYGLKIALSYAIPSDKGVRVSNMAGGLDGSVDLFSPNSKGAFKSIFIDDLIRIYECSFFL